LSKIEAAGLWAYFHKDWLLQMRVLLRPQLPPEYFVFVESEAILVAPDPAQVPKPVLPDVAFARPDRDRAMEPSRQSDHGTAALIELDEPCELLNQYTLLIRRAPENRVVAALELLSPSNKGVGNRFDREKYLRKRTAFLESGVNLLEIDALREGDRVLPTSLGSLAGYERLAWTAFHYDGQRRLRGWGWNQQDPLPAIPWAVEESVEVLVDLPQGIDDACQFNRWPSLVA
jgi:hypothetical protein